MSVGPNAVLGLAREGYRKWSVNPADTVELLRFPGFWRLAPRLARTGIGSSSTRSSRWDTWPGCGATARI
ncbi:hypothetical protein [Tessaracoccus coleopterorum]|uniref:hypothetical protein n=1 Tax=Tessaracoccus coleopterorum TaxID=2714950 RepID=UPI001E2AE0B5|nr:hypothetical protein [Tessaracoccus coleopterorum]